MRMFYRHMITAPMMAMLAVMPLWAITTDEVDAAVAAAKAAPKNQTLNREAADALKDAGRYDEAIAFYRKGGNSGNLGIAESYFMLYEYDNAEEYLDKYLAKRSKAEQARDNEFSYGDGSETLDWTDNLRSRIELGRSMLDRVEKIQVIDSINVPSETFFEFIKLAHNAGSFAGEDQVDKVITRDQLEALGISNLIEPAFISEAGDDMIWYGSTPDGDSKMFESIRLADGSWDKPTPLFDYEKMFGNKNGSWVSYPFLHADGVTLYFAADGENSLGELDIFISRKDADGFLQPSNIGMPYNSPFNDYLYAIDEQTGAGWWATDRNQIPDSVTIYTFIPQDLRINYPVDTPGLVNYARLSSISMTQTDEGNSADIRERIAELSRRKPTASDDGFDFALPSGKVLHSISEFTNRMAASAMNDYLAEQASLANLKDRLAELRLKYAAGDNGTATEILSLEKNIEDKNAELRRQRNLIVSLESGM